MSQFPRPVRDYLWLGAHPVAAVDSTESATGTVTLKHVTFIHSGHLGEPLSETDASGRVLRQYAFAPVGFATPNPYTNSSKSVPVPGVRATKLHFTELALAPCDSIVISDGYGGPVVAEIQASASSDFWTEWLATDKAFVELRAKGCGSARGFNLVEALPEWGGVASQVRTDVTAHPYAAAGQQFRVSMGAGGFIRLKDLNVASCDSVEARTPSGQTLWKWKPLPSVYQVWTPRLTGDVDIGIWGQGCNGVEGKFGFALVEVRADSSASEPVVFGLPGQKLRHDGTIDNWYRTYDAVLGRYLSPEPLLQSPAYVRLMAQSGMSVPTYAHAANNPVRYVDPTGLWTQVIVTMQQSFGIDLGNHMSVRVDNGGDGQSVLFDPGGSYNPPDADGPRGSSDAFEGADSALSPYVRFHRKAGDQVMVLNFDTTAEEEASIARNFGYGTDEGAYGVAGGFCASTTSNNLKGIGPFRNLKPSYSPAAVANQLLPLARSWSLYTYK